MKYLKTFESYESVEDEIRNFVDKQIEHDKSEYKGHIKTKYI